MEYDLFEHEADGSVCWRGNASGIKDANDKLQALAKNTQNPCFAIHLPTREVVAQANMPQHAPSAEPVIFQVAYDAKLAAQMSARLKSEGYNIVTVIGSEAAKVVLSTGQKCQLFVVGHNAPAEDRAELVIWLKQRFPGIYVVALNPPETPALPGADFNTKMNGPETWLPLISQALRAL